MENITAQGDQAPGQILSLIADEIKASLVLTIRSCELAELSDDAKAIAAARIDSTAALQLISSYALGLKLSNLGEHELALEPLAVTSVMAEAARELTPLAEVYGVGLELVSSGRNSPVLAHRRILTAALASTGRSLIEALAHGSAGQQQTLKLMAHNGRHGVVTGWYWQADKITNQALRRAKQLLASSRQPLAGFSGSQLSGVFVADMLLEAMDTQLVASKYRNWTGLVATLKPSSQTSLI